MCNDSFQQAIKFHNMNSVPASIITEDETVPKWAYNVAATRSIEWNRECIIAPMADMINHGTETEVEITFDEEGNFIVYASRDLPAGSPLRMSLGDPTNPTPLFATYGFVDESCPATFCKLMHLQDEMMEIGYDFSNLLFYKETGEIFPEVYAVQLYSLLKNSDANAAREFYQAVINGDEEIKNRFHESYWPYIKEKLQKHVDGTLGQLENFAKKALAFDLETHPRVPMILKHKAFVKEAFLKVKINLDCM